MSFSFGDLSNVESANKKEYAPLPKGQYHCVVQEVDNVMSKSGKHGVKMKFKVASGEHANRILFFTFYIGAPNDQLTKITQGIGKAMLEAVHAPSEVVKMGTSTYLVGKDIMIGVKIAPGIGDYPEKNEYSYCKEYSANPNTLTPSSEFGF